jgi:hypothetical protein
MHFEFYSSITTSCPQYVRHMDYLSEILAMRGRYRRNRTAWTPHLHNTRRFLLSAAERCQNRNKAVVLGAGLLLDVPLYELALMFREVVLVDIYFLPEVRRAVKRYANVRLMLIDITNMAQKLHENIHRGICELPEALPALAEADHNTGLVASVNLLSQLWVIPRAYAMVKLRGLLDEEQVDNWCRQIVESHYAFLLSLPCSVCLVADFEFVKRDHAGKIASHESTIFNFRLPAPEKFWTWHIMPINEGQRYLSKELNVGAWLVR